MDKSGVDAVDESLELLEHEAVSALPERACGLWLVGARPRLGLESYGRQRAAGMQAARVACAGESA